jgi:alpha-1,6-mannosyltransferase
VNRNRLLLLLGVAFLGSMAPVAAAGDLSGRVGLLLALWGTAHLLYLAAGWVVNRPASPPAMGPRAGIPSGGPGRGPFAIVLGVSLVARLLVLPAAPSLSEDVYRYLWDGRLVAHGVNPYPHAPRDPALGRFHDGLLDRLNHSDVPTIYPPAAQLLFAAVARIDPTPLCWKLALLALEAVLWIALLALLRRRSIPPERILLFAWNPLVILESYGNGHLDLAVAAFLVLALALDEARRPASAGVAFALSALCKYTPLLLVPLFLRRRAFVLLGAAAVVAVALYAPFAGAGRTLWTGLLTYLRDWEFNGSLFPILRNTTGSKETAKWILAAFLGLVTVVVSIRSRSAAGTVAALYAAYLLASPTVFPWYLVPLIALLPLVPDAGVLAFSGLVALSYLSLSAYRATGVWALPAWVPWVEYGGAGAVWAGARLLPRRAGGPAEVARGASEDACARESAPT